MSLDGREVQTTYQVDSKFLGEYKGSKKGYLKLNEDGTGTYQYDIFGLAPQSCRRGPIDLEWGFITDENGQIVRFERDYGYSYPIIYKATGETSFQGCRKQVFVDYVLEYKDGNLSISSSGDWRKVN